MNRIMIWLVVAGLLVLTACGGGNTATNNAPPTTTTTNAGTAQIGVTLGDAAADRVVSFEITITSFVLTDSAGKPVTVLASTDPPRKFELTHLSGTVEPVAFLKIPAGTYTGAQIGWANPEVTFINGTAGASQLVEKEFTASGTANVTFTPNLTINTTSVLNIDLDVLKAVNIDFNTNPPTVTVDPNAAFSLTSATQVAEANEDENEKGELEDVVGTIIGPAPTSTSFTIKTTAGATMTFATDTSTKMELEGVSALALDMIVKVEGITKADGTFFAKEVEAEANDDVNGLEAEGLVSSIASSGTSFTIVDHENMGRSMAGMAGKPLTVNTSSNTKFLIDNKNNRVNLSGLAFATFTKVSLGQQVEADAETAMASASVTAKKVKLQQQALRGTVSNLTSDSFTLTLSSESAFALITGKTTVTVSKSTAVVKPGANLANGSAVRVRGLLFSDGTTYNLVAGRITP